MIAVGIDISKAKSTVAVIDSDGTVLASPFTMAHTQPEMEAFVTYLKGLGEPTTILMEYTGHYHYPVLKKLQDEGFPVCIVNPYQMKKYGDVEIHKAKTDKKDALRIAAYAPEKSYKLVPYSSMDQKYEDLKFLSRQYSQRITYVAKLKVQLIALLDQTMPGITRILPLNSRNPEKCALLLSTTQNAADEIISQMRNIAETIPEYKVLRAMHGVGDRLGPIILAEIGDIRRFHSGKALNSYAGNDAPPYQSGQFESRNRHISKRGSSALRKACYEVMQALKLTKPQDDPVYLFMLKKEQEGKPFNVAKMAGVNKFLRIYYARAMEFYK